MANWHLVGMWFKGFYLLYFAAVLLYLYFVLRRRPSPLPEIALGAAFLLNSIEIGRAWIRSGQPPFQSLFQSLLFLTWSITLFTFLARSLTKLRILGLFTALASFLALNVALLKVDMLEVLMPPALRSVWFIPHVVLYFFGYGALFVSFVTAGLYFKYPVARQIAKSYWLGFEEIDFEAFTYEAVKFGFLLLTLGLFIGAVWAERAWSAYWSWDPKENWALITWLIYLTYLHLRRSPKWRGKPSSIFALIGFLAVLFTYIGVNYLPTIAEALHVYQ